MKRLLASVVVALAVLTAGTAATQASLLVHDNFNRADGNLVGTNPTPGPGSAWAAHSGTNGPVQISGGQIQIVQNASAVAAEDVNVSAASPMQPGERWYAAFDVTVNQPGASIANVYFAHFLLGTSSFPSRLWVTAGAQSGYRLVLTNGATMANGAFTGDLVLGDTYRVVVSYDRSALSGSLWIDQTLESGTSFNPADAGSNFAVTGFAFRQGSPSGALTTTQTVDNLCVATSYNEAYNCIPEPGTLGLFGIAALALIRRRR